MGRERIEEVKDPELTIERALETYVKKDTPESGLINVYNLFKYGKNLQMNGKAEV